MRTEPVEFQIERTPEVFEPIDAQLRKGLEIDISEIEIKYNLLSYAGRQVLLYIKDHSRSFDRALENPSNGNKFHVAHCATLEQMQQAGRFKRYVVTNSLTGLFTIEDGSVGGTARTAEVALKVCQNCIKQLNYRNAALDNAARYEVVKTFKLKDFFSNFSSCFKYMPAEWGRNQTVGYTKDWSDLSRQTREAHAYTCGECGVDLSGHKHLCDVHHVNGVRSDNSAQNLRVLCRHCHRNQPMHEGLYVSRADMQLITDLWNEQQKQRGFDPAKNGWDAMMAIIDPSILGDVRHLQKRRFEPPIIGYRIVVGGKQIATLDVAWPERRVGIAFDKLEIPGWDVFEVGEISANYQR